MGRVVRVHSFLALGLCSACLVACQEGGEPSDPQLSETPSTELSPLGGPSLTMVRNEDGGVQVRESSSTKFVLTGVDLADTTSVTVENCYESLITSATATEVRVTSQCFGMTRGALLDVSVTTPGGTDSLPDALLVTPFVMGPTAPLMGGRGTFESPMHLCDPDLDWWISTGNLMHLLGGVHTCGDPPMLMGSIDIEGAVDGSTVIQGDGANGFRFAIYTSDNRAVTIRRLTFAAPLAHQSIQVSYTEGSEANVTIEDVAGGRISVLNAANVVIDDVSFDGPAWAMDPTIPALEVSAFQLTLTDTTLRCDGTAGTVGLSLRSIEPWGAGNVTATRVQVERCGRGVEVCPGGGSPWDRQFQLSELTLVDNDLGMAVSCGMVTLRDSEIRGDITTALPSRYGIAFGGGQMEIYDTEIKSQSLVGISQTTSRSPGENDPVAGLLLDGVEITGAQIGVDFSGYDGGTDITIRRSEIRGQSQACVRTHGYESTIDFGTEFDPGQNEFSALSGGFAIDDVRNDTLPDYFYLDARGTKLNGLSFDTAIIEGPASLPPYFRITHGVSGIRF